MENRAFGALATALLLCCAFNPAAATEPLRVLYAEPFQAQALRTPGVQKPGPANLRVQAFGRTFELQLEDNSRLLRATSAATRARFGAIQLLKGTIKDAPGSWVRLTLKQGRYSGAFWDGAELYAVTPREELDSALLTPMAAAATGIYRLSDTQGGLFSGTCALADSEPSTASPTARFRSLVGELRAAADTAFAAAPREIEISMIGDVELSNRFGSGAAQAMLDRMNVVDGIFSNQVGVATVPTDFITFDTNPDPFTSSAPSTLLEELGNYRNATPTVRSRGLAHLLTGRQLDGDIVGIAYLGSVCTARTGAGLTEISSFIDSPLVIAHELGHNFGAPHDGESGSPCVNTPPSFLMAPEIGGSSTFSACSLQQIQTRIQAASCIVPTRNRDLAVTAPAEEIQAVINQPFQYVLDVDSVGTSTALNAVLTMQAAGPLVVMSASLPGGTCSAPFGLVRCELGDVAPGENRRLTLTLRSPVTLDALLTGTVASTGDVNPGNDSRGVIVHVLPERAIGLTIAPQPLTVTTGQAFDLTYDVAASGVATLNDVTVEIGYDNLTPLAASVPGGSCTVQATIRTISCELGSIAVNTTRRVTVQWTSDVAGPLGGFVRAFEAATPDAAAVTSYRIIVQAARDIALATTETFKRVALGQDATYSLQVESLGLNTVDDVRLELTADPAVTLTVDGPLAANCTSAGGTTNCALGAMPSQSSRTVQFRARADVAINTQIQARVLLPTPDNAPGNETASLFLDVRVADEIRLNVFDPQPGFDGRVNSLLATVATEGVNPSTNVRMNVTLPTGFAILTATFDNQFCTVDVATPHLATCLLPRIEVLSAVLLQVTFIAPETGTLTGTVEISADNDTDLTNNSRSVSIETRPSIDGALIGPPQLERARTDMPIDLVYTVTTNRYALPDARLNFVWSAPLDQFSATAPGATCGDTPGGYTCEWASLAANSNIPVAVRLRSSVRSNVAITANLLAAADTDTINNNAFMVVPIVVPGDVSVSLTQTAATATTGRSVNLPDIEVVTLAAVENGYIELEYDTSRLQFGGTTNASCFQSEPLPLRCQVSGMEAPGTQRVTVQFIPQSAGVFPISVRVGALNDFNTTNDEQTLTLTVVDPTPPPPPPAPSGGGGGGGGGGGSMSWLFAALLLMMWHHRRARSRVHR